MATRLYLVRHGATQLSAENRFAGAVGVELSDEGRDQAQRLGRRLADDRITAAALLAGDRPSPAGSKAAG